MKRCLSIVLACIIFLGLTACGSSGNSSNSINPSNSINSNNQADESKVEVVRTINEYDLMQALSNAGYSVQEYDGITAEDMNIGNAVSFVPMSFYKEADGVEKMGEIYFIAFTNPVEAVSSYNMFLSMSEEEGFGFRNLTTDKGLKSVFTDDSDPDFGAAYVISQLDNTLIFAIEEWDIDTAGTYDHEMHNILISMGY